MAKGKKSSGKNYTSKGERNNVSKWSCQKGRKDRSVLDMVSDKMKAFKQGKDVYVTIPNPNKNETNKRFIRVNAKTVWTKTNPFSMKLEG